MVSLPTATTATAPSTVTTSVRTVVGTTPAGETVTETSTQLTTTPAGPDGVPLESGFPLAPATSTTSTTVTGQTIDGVQCSRLNQLAYQAYAHLQVYVRGHARALPGSIGLVNPATSHTGTVTTYSGGLCSYWINTRAANGLIAVQSPVAETYTLGDLFDIWGEPLSGTRVAGSRGAVTALVNGRRWHGNPRGIPLREHESIQLAVGRPIPRYVPVDWSDTDL